MAMVVMQWCLQRKQVGQAGVVKQPDHRDTTGIPPKTPSSFMSLLVPQTGCHLFDDESSAVSFT